MLVAAALLAAVGARDVLILAVDTSDRCDCHLMRPRWEQYAAVHSYALHWATSVREHPKVEKWALALERLRAHRLVMVVDCDTAPANCSIGVEGRAKSDLTLAEDSYASFNYNSGVTIWRRTEWSFQLLDKLVARLRAFRVHPTRKRLFFDQQHLVALLRAETNQSHITVTHPRHMNGFRRAQRYNDNPKRVYRAGDWIVHFTGMTGAGDAREKYMLMSTTLSEVGPCAI